jgi:hypothetical protein
MKVEKKFYSLTLKIKAVCAPETPFDIYRVRQANSVFIWHYPYKKGG